MDRFLLEIIPVSSFGGHAIKSNRKGNRERHFDVFLSFVRSPASYTWDVQISCCPFDGWVIVRLRDSDWQSMQKERSIAIFGAGKCRWPVVS
jgi:hypothetical protein